MLDNGDLAHQISYDLLVDCIEYASDDLTTYVNDNLDVITCGNYSDLDSIQQDIADQEDVLAMFKEYNEIENKLYSVKLNHFKQLKNWIKNKVSLINRESLQAELLEC